MARPLLNTFCYCGSLRFGSILSGFLAIILSIISLALISTRTEVNTIVLDWLPPTVVKIILAINLIMAIIFSTLMIVGVFKRNNFCMLPWLTLGIMIGLASLVFVIYIAVVVYFMDGFPTIGTLWLVIGLICVALFTYSWCVVYSLYTIMSEENKRGIYDKSPSRR